MDKIEELLTRRVANIIPNKQTLDKVLHSSKKLNVYLGIDPTAIHIHLGHTVPLRKLQAFADLGHNVTFLIGDFTALIGDTSDKDAERPKLTKEQIQENFKTYKKQAERILDFSKVKVRYNSQWLSNLSFEEIIQLCQHFSFGDFASRELIRKRLNESKHVGLHEALYPVMQGYDSYYMDTDVQIGGTDQTFNMQAGRTLQKDLRGRESFILATEFLSGTDGRKMSKTWGNALWLTDYPNDIYGKVMSIADGVIIQYFTLATNMSLSDIKTIESRLKSGENPMEIKKVLATQIVTELHSKDVAKTAQENFERVSQQKHAPAFFPTVLLPKAFISNASVAAGTVEVGLASSLSEAKRVIEQGGIRINNKVISDSKAPLASYVPRSGATIQRGPIKFVKIITKR